MSTVTRKIKNVVKQYSFAEIRVREATSNDAWGPTPKQLDEVAELSHHNVAIVEMLGIIFKRLGERGKNWRHVYKSLIVLDHLIKCGSEKVAQYAVERLNLLRALSTYDLYEEGMDVGLMIKDKSKSVVTLLTDQDRLKNERTKMLNSRRIYAQNTGSGKGIGSPVLSKEIVKNKKSRGITSLPVSPVMLGSNPSEDDYQLQLALKMSIEQHEEEERKRKLEEVRLQSALEESKRVQEPTFNGDFDHDPFGDRHRPLCKRLTLLSIARQHSNQAESFIDTSEGGYDEDDQFDPFTNGQKVKSETFDPWEDLASVFSSNAATTFDADLWKTTRSEAVCNFESRSFDSGLKQNFDSDLAWTGMSSTTTTSASNFNNNIAVTTTTTNSCSRPQVMFSPTNPFYSILTQQSSVSMPTAATRDVPEALTTVTKSASPWEQFLSSSSHDNALSFPSTNQSLMKEGPESHGFYDSSHNFNNGRIHNSFGADHPPLNQPQTNPFL